MLVFYDSGIGGLSVVKEWQKLYKPNQTTSSQTLYLADSQIFPLGEKTKQTAQKEISQSLEQKFPTNPNQEKDQEKNGYLVLACNSASSLDLRPNINLRIINIIDTTINYLQTTFNPKTAQPLVLCTTLTKNAGYLEQALKKISITNFQILDTPLAKFIENPTINPTTNLKQESDQNLDQNTNQITQELLKLKNQVKPNFNPNLILLACTHYNFVASQIEFVFNLPVVKQDIIMAKYLISLNILPSTPNLTAINFLATGKKPTLSPQIAHFLQSPILNLF